MTEPQGWKKIRPVEYPAAEAFLREREIFCVGACSRFLARNFNHNHLWTVRNAQGGMAAFLLHSRLSLYPIFPANRYIQLPGFLGRFLKKIPIHSVQGLREDTEILEEGIVKLGYNAIDRIDYDLMTLDREPRSECFQRGPSGLVLRKPVPKDTEGLYQLQAAYEIEEVLPRGETFNPKACQKTLEKLLETQQVMLACMGDEIIGKINTNAVSFTRFQIGGVYVHPKFRGLGIAVKMSAVFLQQLTAEGRGITLFVKKRNAAARSVYRRLGFIQRGDYRISYY